MLHKVLLILGAVITFTACNSSNAINPSANCYYPVRSDTEKKNDHWLIRPMRDYKGVETNTIPLPRQEFVDKVEAGINKQINLELFAHYTYLSMAYHFDRDDIYMPGFHKFFLKMAEEEYEHAQMFMKYQNKRGGRIQLRSIGEPCSIWGSGTEAMSKALNLEKDINIALLDLHKVGSKSSQPQFLDFLESNFLGEQVESIKQLSDYVNILKRFNSPLGEYQFDKLTLMNKK